MTTATFRCVIVRAAGNLFAIPTANVERVVSLKQEEIKTVENRQTIELNGSAVSLVRFEDTLGLTRQKSAGNNEGKPTAIVLHIDDKRIAFLLDEVINELRQLGAEDADDDAQPPARPQLGAPRPSPARIAAQALRDGTWANAWRTGSDADMMSQSAAAGDVQGKPFHQQPTVAIGGEEEPLPLPCDAVSPEYGMRRPVDIHKYRPLGGCYWRSVARLGVQLADALQYAHRQWLGDRS